MSAYLHRLAARSAGAPPPPYAAAPAAARPASADGDFFRDDEPATEPPEPNSTASPSPAAARPLPDATGQQLTPVIPPVLPAPWPLPPEPAVDVPPAGPAPGRNPLWLPAPVPDLVSPRPAADPALGLPPDPVPVAAGPDDHSVRAHTASPHAFDKVPQQEASYPPRADSAYDIADGFFQDLLRRAPAAPAADPAPMSPAAEPPAASEPSDLPPVVLRPSDPSHSEPQQPPAVEVVIGPVVVEVVPAPAPVALAAPAPARPRAVPAAALGGSTPGPVRRFGLGQR
ncbi:hypothetical protein [Streptomyces sp. NPDC059874]|uniref:hypothetical protein n=1 Tax=Streptomyces sp. NPDC059874 TaxID=3346983 RepID=UPI0036578377